MKRYQTFWIVFFLLLLILPAAVLLPAAGKYRYQSSYETDGQKLQKVPKPPQKAGGWSSYFSKWSKYMDQRFGFHRELASAAAFCKETFFHSGNASVIVGKDGYLFLAGEDGTQEEFLKIRTMSDRQLFDEAKGLALLQEACQAKGCNFYFTVAPAKNELIPQEMPLLAQWCRSLNQSKGCKNNLDLLKKELKRQGVHYVDLSTVLLQEQEPVCRKRDQHWNKTGALIADQTLVQAAGHESRLDAFADKKLFIPKEPGDIDSKLYPLSIKKDSDVHYDLDLPEPNDGWLLSEGWSNFTQNPKGKGTVLLFHDSFGKALAPFLAGEYRTGNFYWEGQFCLDYVTEKETDVFVETAQRTLPNMLGGSMVFDAPLRTGLDLNPIPITGQTDFSMKKKRGWEKYLFYVFGSLDQAYVDDNSPVYIRASAKKGTSFMYEAVPLANGEYMDKADQLAYAYNLRINTKKLPAGKYELEVIVKKGNKYYTSGPLKTIMIP